MLQEIKIHGYLLIIIALLASPFAAQAQSANFRVTLNGFKVNQQTLEGLRFIDGMGDEVFFLSYVSTVDVSLAASSRWVSTYEATIGANPPNGIRGGTASSSGGLITGDAIPRDNPIQRAAIIPGSGTPPWILFEGEIIRNRNAALIIPTIWERDDADNLALVKGYINAIDRDRMTVFRNVAGMTITPRALALNSFLFSGGLLGIGGTVDLARDIPQDRPIGMHFRQEAFIFNFTPQTLVLTYEAAEYISRTDFGSGVGIIPVRYMDAPYFQGDYTLYLQVENLRGSSTTQAGSAGVLSVMKLPSGKQLGGIFAATAATSKFAVTDAKFKADEQKVLSKCPALIGFSGSVTANGAGEVTYTFMRSDGATSPVQTLNFTEAGTRAVSTSWTLGGAGLMSYEGWQTLRILSPNELTTPQTDGKFWMNCEK